MSTAMSERSLVEQLAAFARRPPATIPDAVVDSVRQRLLDILGIQIAATSLDTSVAAARFVGSQGGTGQATAIGMAGPVPAPWAAFLNGVLAHSLDYDYTHLPSIVHPSATVVPAALAAAELVDADARTFAAAVAVGLEITVRLGMAGYDHDTRNSTYFEHGQHATSICGAIGSAAAAVVLDLRETQVADAMAIAVSMAAGVIEANRTGGTVKRLHCGWAAHSGVTAALLAREGFTGPPPALEGRFGLFQAFLHGRFCREALVGALGERWLVPDIFFKPYPANHFTHGAIDAALELRDAGVDADDVESAELRVASAAVRTIGEPLSRKQRPRTGYEAQFSGPYVVAASLLGGSGLGLGLDDFTDALANDPARRALMSRVRVIGDGECDRVFPDQFPAMLTVWTRGGGPVDARVLHNRGGPQRPLTDDELRTKFRDNVSSVLPAGRVAELEQAIAGFPGGCRLHDLLAAFGDLDPVGDRR